MYLPTHQKFNRTDAISVDTKFSNKADKVAEIKNLLNSSNIINFYIRKNYGQVNALLKGSPSQFTGQSLLTPRNQWPQNLKNSTLKKKVSSRYSPLFNWSLRFWFKPKEKKLGGSNRKRTTTRQRKKEKTY